MNDDEVYNEELGNLVIQLSFWDSGHLTFKVVNDLTLDEVADILLHQALDLKRACFARKIKALEN